MGYSIKDIHHVKESIKVGSFSKEWWKQLVKLLKKCDVSNNERIMVYIKIAEGLYTECLSLCKDNETAWYINENVESLNKMVTEELFYSSKEDENNG